HPLSQLCNHFVFTGIALPPLPGADAIIPPGQLLLLLPGLLSGGAVSHGDVGLLQPLAGEHLPQTVHLAFQGFPYAGVLTDELDLHLLAAVLDMDFQWPQFCRIQLDLDTAQVLAGHPHHPLDHALAPALMTEGYTLWLRGTGDRAGRQRGGGSTRGNTRGAVSRARTFALP